MTDLVKLPLFSSVQSELYLHQDSDLHMDVVDIKEFPIIEDKKIRDKTVRLFSGDLCSYNPNRFVRFAKAMSEAYPLTLITLGNHDYWDTRLDIAKSKYTDLLRNNGIGNVIILSADEPISLDPETHVIGDTLWTDMWNDPLGPFDFPVYMVDARKIRIRATYSRINGHILLKEHIEQLGDIVEKLDAIPESHKIIISSHHAPSLQSISPYYKYHGNYSAANKYYCSDLEWVMNRYKNISHWFHGHVHECFNYHVANTNIICNPKGHPGDAGSRNHDFPYNPLNLVRIR